MAEINIAQPMRFRVDVRSGLVEQPQRGSLMRGDKRANRIIVELVDGAGTFDITGVEVKGKFCRPPDMDEIELTGTAEGNIAIVELSDPCYANGGHYEATVSLVLDGVERTVLFISGDVLKSGSGNAAGDEETGGSGGSTGSGLPAGGTAGQVLVKVSSAQGDAIWENLTAADVGALGKNEKAANATRLNGKDAKYYLGARNLLDNSNFKDFIAQAGVLGTHGTIQYVGDRWKAVNIASASASKTEGLVLTTDVLAGHTLQVVPVRAGTTYTAAIKGIGNNVQFAVCNRTVDSVYNVASGALDGVLTLTFTPNEDYCTFLFYPGFADGGGTATLEWAALYEGEYTADNLPPYIPKEYAAELAECRLYCIPNDTALVVKSVDDKFAVGKIFVMRDMGALRPTVTIKKFTAPYKADVLEFADTDFVSEEILGPGCYLLNVAGLSTCSAYDSGVLRLEINADL